MKKPLSILMVEDSPDDALLVSATLERNGLAHVVARVDNEEQFRSALDQGGFDLILSDSQMPSFSGPDALRLYRERLAHLDEAQRALAEVPFVFVSGTLGEERAIEMLKGGATDYVLKDRLIRLPSVIERAMADAEERTARRAVQQQFFHAQKMEAVGRLAAGIAHDFNNLLTVILGYTEMLMKPSLDERARGHAERVLDAGNRAMILTRRLLTFSRESAAEIQVLDLNRVVADMEALVRTAIGDQHELQLELAPEPALVRADAGQMDQVLMNLAINARDAMPEGGTVTVSTACLTLPEAEHPTPAGEYVCLGVSDSGIGMSPETQARIFEPFFTTKPVGVGTGLGLSTVFGIARQSGGFVRVKSALGEGTTMEVLLPVAAAAEAAGNAEAGA